MDKPIFKFFKNPLVAILASNIFSEDKSLQFYLQFEVYLIVISNHTDRKVYHHFHEVKKKNYGGIYKKNISGNFFFIFILFRGIQHFLF